MKKKLRELTKNKILVGICCIGVSVLFTLVNISIKGRTSKIKETVVLITTEDISAGDKISESMISEIKIQGDIPENFINSKDDVLGKYANINMRENDFLTNEKLSVEPIYGSAYLVKRK